MSLKTGRKGKYKGGSFASTFRAGIAMKSPFNEVAVASNEAADEMPRSPVDGAAAAANAEPKSNPNDIIPSDTDYSREEVDAYFQRRKLAKEKEELEKLQKQKDPTTPGGGDETPTGDGGTIGFSDDYDDTDTAKSIRQENRENKKEIRQAAKAEKQAVKDDFKNTKADIKASGLKGKAKRKAKSAARKDKRAAKKDIRKSKRSAKKDNRAKKKAAKKARKGRK